MFQWVERLRQCLQGNTPRSQARKLNFESLEPRLALYNLSGLAWDQADISYSLVPDEMLWTSSHGSGPSMLFETLNELAAEDVWQREIARAMQTWANATNLNFHQVRDDGAPRGSVTGQQGDIRLAAVDVRSAAAWATHPGPGSGGDITINAGGASFTELFWSESRFHSLVRHEAGHSLGLDHSEVWQTVMGTSGELDGLAPDDIAGIQAIYGVRQHDQFDRLAANNSYATASSLPTSGVEQIEFQADLTSHFDVDYYRFTAPSGGSSFQVSVDARQLSLLAPALRVYDAQQNLIAVASGEYGTVATVHIDGLQAGQTYTIVADGASSDEFGMGAYKLSVQIDRALDPQPPATAGSATGASTDAEPNPADDNNSHAGNMDSVTETGEPHSVDGGHDDVPTSHHDHNHGGNADLPSQNNQPDVGDDTEDAAETPVTHGSPMTIGWLRRLLAGGSTTAHPESALNDTTAAKSPQDEAVAVPEKAATSPTSNSQDVTLETNDEPEVVTSSPEDEATSNAPVEAVIALVEDDSANKEADAPTRVDEEPDSGQPAEDSDGTPVTDEQPSDVIEPPTPAVAPPAVVEDSADRHESAVGEERPGGDSTDSAAATDEITESPGNATPVAPESESQPVQTPPTVGRLRRILAAWIAREGDEAAIDEPTAPASNVTATSQAVSSRGNGNAAGTFVTSDKGKSDSSTTPPPAPLGASGPVSEEVPPSHESVTSTQPSLEASAAPLPIPLAETIVAATLSEPELAKANEATYVDPPPAPPTRGAVEDPRDAFFARVGRRLFIASHLPGIDLDTIESSNADRLLDTSATTESVDQILATDWHESVA